jgi:hypothetical protein
LKYYPYIGGVHPKKEDIFDQDGNLKKEYPTVWELRVISRGKIEKRDAVITQQQKELEAYAKLVLDLQQKTKEKDPNWQNNKMNYVGME